MISSEFRQNVASGDLDTVRSALIDYLIIDRSFKRFDEALAYAQKTLDIIEPFSNEPPFSEEPWDSNYLNQQKVALMMNFSTERINHIKKVITKVLPSKEAANHQSSNTPYTSGAFERTGSKTGRTVVSEKPVHPRNATKKQTDGSSLRQQIRPTELSRRGIQSSGHSGKTGSRVIKETVTQTKKNEDTKKKETDFLSTTLIVGGAAVAAVGIATVEPIVIGAGIVVAGTGVGIKVKNGR